MTASVALESTVFAFGLPPREAFELGGDLNRGVAQEGATPVPIAIVEGEVRYGFSETVLKTVCEAEGFIKANSRDLGPLMAGGRSGATTVSATCVLAAKKGIRVFATGGIGGVHRGSEHTFDESLDLIALKENPVAVVSAGAKSILDLPKTLERLETLGVPVWGYRTDAFPEFYHGGRELRLDWRFDEPEALAMALKKHWELHPHTGVLVCNPIPEEDALPAAQVDSWLEVALAEARTKNITGKPLTPYLLNAMRLLSEGATVRANLALLKNNASVAARVAVALEQLK